MAERIVMLPKLKWRLPKTAKFSGKCTSPSGQSGTRYKKKHERARQPAGMPMGQCAKVMHGTQASNRTCNCGGCGAK